jgi:sugar (pentulose or hexulose) kinase
VAGTRQCGGALLPPVPSLFDLHHPALHPPQTELGSWVPRGSYAYTLAPVQKEPLTLVGGVARSELIVQILADVLQQEVLVPAHPEHAPAVGAAVLAAAAIASAASPATPEADLAPGQLHIGAPALARLARPWAEHAALYEAAYRRFRQLHPALADVFAQQG